jgi:hypothetical protein
MSLMATSLKLKGGVSQGVVSRAWQEMECSPAVLETRDDGANESTLGSSVLVRTSNFSEDVLVYLDAIRLDSNKAVKTVSNDEKVDVERGMTYVRSEEDISAFAIVRLTTVRWARSLAPRCLKISG